jgi:hypothetical protein
MDPRGVLTPEKSDSPLLSLKEEINSRTLPYPIRSGESGQLRLRAAELG